MDLTEKIQLFEKNYLHLFVLYRRGKFEQCVEPDKFQFHQPAEEATCGNKTPQTLQPASDDLYGLAQCLDQTITDPHLATSERERLAELILKARVLSYEIDDYFLKTTESKAEYFIQLAEDIGSDLRGYFAKHYSFVRSRERQRKIIQYLLLAALCGINESYRRHHKDEYQAGIERGRKILDCIDNELPRLTDSPRDSSLGLRGLCHYILGRLSLVLSRYEQAAYHFRQSVESYSERVQIKDYLFKQRESKLLPSQLESEREALEISHLVTLRRCALASVFGSAYLALVNGRVREALSLSALSRSALKQDCGKVYAAYTEFIYWSAKRAEASSQPEILRNVRRGLRQCLYVFRAYVPQTHYVYRTGIQLGLVYHYLANAPGIESRPLRRHWYQQLAKKYLRQACDFAEGKNGRPPNRRLYVEAAIMLSRVLCKSEPDHHNSGPDKYKIAEEIARRALVALDPNQDENVVREIDYDISDTHLALSSVYSSKAKEMEEKDPERIRVIADARWHVMRALDHNKGTNARIQAAAYLRLADLSLLDPNTWPEVRYFYERWLEVEKFVEHDFLHKWAQRIEERRRYINEYLYIDPRASLSLPYWQERVEERILNAALQELARELRQEQQQVIENEPGRKEPGPAKRRQRNLSRKSLIRDFLVKNLDVPRSTAYRKIEGYKLEAKLADYLR